jgi:hypothetical protein
MNKLTSSLLDEIILTSAMKLFVELRKSSSHADSETVLTLSHVCRGWYEALTRQLNDRCKVQQNGRCNVLSVFDS